MEKLDLFSTGIDACGHFVHPECGCRDGSLSNTNDGSNSQCQLNLQLKTMAVGISNKKLENLTFGSETNLYLTFSNRIFTVYTL